MFKKLGKGFPTFIERDLYIPTPVDYLTNVLSQSFMATTTFQFVNAYKQEVYFRNINYKREI